MCPKLDLSINWSVQNRHFKINPFSKMGTVAKLESVKIELICYEKPV
jgi:hypothetical protein